MSRKFVLNTELETLINTVKQKTNNKPSKEVTSPFLFLLDLIEDLQERITILENKP